MTLPFVNVNIVICPLPPGVDTSSEPTAKKHRAIDCFEPSHTVITTIDVPHLPQPHSIVWNMQREVLKNPRT